MTEVRTLMSEFGVMDEIEEVKESEDETEELLDDSCMPSSIGFVKTPGGANMRGSPEAFAGYTQESHMSKSMVSVSGPSDRYNRPMTNSGIHKSVLEQEKKKEDLKGLKLYLRAGATGIGQGSNHQSRSRTDRLDGKAATAEDQRKPVVEMAPTRNRFQT